MWWSRWMPSALKHLRMVSEGDTGKDVGEFFHQFLSGVEVLPQLESLLLERKLDHHASVANREAAPLFVKAETLTSFTELHAGTLRKLSFRNIVTGDGATNPFRQGDTVLPAVTSWFLPLRPIFAKLQLERVEVLKDSLATIDVEADPLYDWEEQVEKRAKAEESIKVVDAAPEHPNVDAVFDFAPWLMG